MSQARSIPDMDALGRRLLVERMSRSSVALLGSSDRDNQIQLRAGIDDPADASQNPVYFAKSPKTIDINRHQTRGLREQFFVCHESPDDFSVSPVRASCVHYQPQRKTHFGYSHRIFVAGKTRCESAFRRSYSMDRAQARRIKLTISSQFAATTPRRECARVISPPEPPAVARASNSARPA